MDLLTGHWPARSLAHHSSLVRSIVLRSKSLRHERTRASGVSSLERLVGWFGRHSRPWSSVYPPLSMSRSRRGRPSSCVTVTSVGAETFSKIKVALSRLPFLTPPSIAVAPSFSIVVQSSPSRRRRRRHVFACRIWPLPQLPRSPLKEGMWPPPRHRHRSAVVAVDLPARPPVCLSVCLSVASTHSTICPPSMGAGWRGGPCSPLTTTSGHVGSLRPPALHVGKSGKWDKGVRRRASSSSILYLQRSAASISILHHHHHHHHLSLQSVMKDEREHVMRRGDEKRCMHKH